MEIRNLSTFIKVAELGSVSAAAKQLGYAQSTVTAQLQQLEGELGTQLFDRAHKRIFITDAGRRFLVLAEEIEALQARALALGQTESEQPAGMVRLGMDVALQASLLPQLLEQLQETYPQIELQSSVAESETLQHQLEEKELDAVILLHGREKMPAAIAQVFTQRLSWTAVASPAYLEQLQQSLCKIENLRGKSAGHGNAAASTAYVLWRRQAETGAAESWQILYMQPDAAVRMALTARGVAVVPELCVRTELAEGLLLKCSSGAQQQKTRQPQAWSGEALQLSLLKRKEGQTSAAQDAVLALLEQQLASEKSLC